MMTREKRDIRPVLFKLGVALAFSVGSILFSILRTKKVKPSGSPPSQPSHPEHPNQADSVEERIELKNDEDDHVLLRATSSCNFALASSERDEPSLLSKTSSGCLSGNCSPSKRSNGDKDVYLLPEFNDLVKEFDLAAMKATFSPHKDVEMLTNSCVQKLDHEQELNSLRNMVKTLKERERSLEIQLLEYYGLKEQETAVMELHNRLKINNMEAKLFNLKIESLQADKRRLEEQVADYARVVSELEAAKTKIKLLKKKLRSEAEHNREHILALQERVVKLQDQEKKALCTDSDLQLKLQQLKDYEEEAEELKKSNHILRQENSALAQKLEYVQTLAVSVLDGEKVEALKSESNRLRQENEDKAREIEQLQAARCSDIEELVYLRWINACLRYELRNYQPDPDKTVARDLSKSLSPKSEEKAKQLILEYARKEGTGEKGISIADFDSDRWSSSQASYLTESGENDDLSVECSSTNKTNTSSKTKIFGKLRQLLRGKGSSHLRRSSSLESAPSMEYMVGKSSSISPVCNAGVSPGTAFGDDGLNARSRTSSQSSSRLSLDLQRFPYLQGSNSGKGEESSNLECIQRNSSEGSSCVYRVMNPISEDVTNLSKENQYQHQQSSTDAKKSELLKYADALKDSRRKPTVRKRSVSCTL
ncbi:protein CHUP1, chloroplastic-like [Coffea arabica]|uniref:Protein CHUP1, chloroplastic-like n=1 Tax=Coffea arabica TaxID=13443 RepID=A0ABM4U297_COFAR|nr:protein CHUP1, chloroplastic [Coffea arabica]XP_027124610.1 protein CHUP1, chloroplastic [Coffea arabica]